MIDDQSDAFKKAVRDFLVKKEKAATANLVEAQITAAIAAARRIAAEVRRSRSSELSSADKLFLKGLCIEPW